MVPGDRLVCAFVQPQVVGAQFSSWLLHVTIVPWFRLSESSENIAEDLTKALASIQPLTLRGTEQVLMGARKRHTRLVEPAAPLTDIEARVRNYFHKKQAWLVDETTKNPGNTAHTSLTKRAVNLGAAKVFVFQAYTLWSKRVIIR